MPCSPRHDGEPASEHNSIARAVCRRSSVCLLFFFFSSRRRHTRFDCDWSSDVCSSDLAGKLAVNSFVRIEKCFAGRIPYVQAFDYGDADALLENRRFFKQRAEAHFSRPDRKSTRLNSSHSQISYAVFCLKKKNMYSLVC